MLRHKRLVVTLDAFSTLFTPREPIGKSYADAARRYGLSGFTDDQIASNFRNAFKFEQARAPNYGQKLGLGASEWWTRVIHTTIQPFMSPEMVLPKELTSDLLTRFSSSEGYILYPDVVGMFRNLNDMKKSLSTGSSTLEIVVGIITNSDDRVPSILSSLGLQVGTLRYGSQCSFNQARKNATPNDVDFIVLSYDVGFEKPMPEIFHAAETLGSLGCPLDSYATRHMHIGDEVANDFDGAKRAGWEALLLDREGRCDQDEYAIIKDLRDLERFITLDTRA